MMNNLIAMLVLSIFSFGCAHSAKKAENERSLVYTKQVKSENLGEISASGAFSCPNRRRSWKNESWKKVVELANNCVREGKWSSVEDMGNFLSQEHHQGPWGPYYLSLSAEANKNTSRALWMIDLALKKSPNLGLLHYQKGRVLWSVEEYGGAMQSFQQAIDLDSDLVAAHTFVGQVYLRDQQPAKAEYHFNKIISQDPNHRVALEGLTECHELQGDYGAALKTLQQAILTYPRTLEYRLREASIYEVQQKDYEQALAAYKKIKVMMSENRLAGNSNIDLDKKITSLEALLGKNTSPEKVSQNSSRKLRRSK